MGDRDETPETGRELAVFPLTGVLLLPGTLLPLRIFEPRYLAMVEDALAGNGEIGMIQPRVPALDNWGMVDPGERPDLHAVGCRGRIERWEEAGEGRFRIVLLGRQRFRVSRELPERRGYRRVEAAEEEFARDLEEAALEVEPGPLLRAAAALGERHGFALDLELLATLPGARLLNALCVVLPFGPREKQALLEAEGVEARRDLLLELVAVELARPGNEVVPGEATLH